MCGSVIAEYLGTGNDRDDLYFKRLEQNLSILQCMWNQSQAHMFVFQIKLIKLFSKLLSKTFAYKIERYGEVLQIIIPQPRGTNLFFLQVYLESTVKKRKCLCFGLREERREDWHDERIFLKTLSKKETIELICLCVTQ